MSYGIFLQKNHIINPKILENYSWDEISYISQSGNARQYFNIGDIKTVLISEDYGETYYENQARIIGFDHDYLEPRDRPFYNNRKTAGITFELIKPLKNKVKLLTNLNVVNWPQVEGYVYVDVPRFNNIRIQVPSVQVVKPQFSKGTEPTYNDWSDYWQEYSMQDRLKHQYKTRQYVNNYFILSQSEYKRGINIQGFAYNYGHGLIEDIDIQIELDRPYEFYDSATTTDYIKLNFNEQPVPYYTRSLVKQEYTSQTVDFVDPGSTIDIYTYNDYLSYIDTKGQGASGRPFDGAYVSLAFCV